jgi:hypothetical protein
MPADVIIATTPIIIIIRINWMFEYLQYLMRKALMLLTFYRWEYWGSARLTNC